MAEKDFGDYFISDTDEDLVDEDEDIVPPVVLPAPAAPAPSQAASVAPTPPPVNTSAVVPPPVVPAVAPNVAEPVPAESPSEPEVETPVIEIPDASVAAEAPAVPEPVVPTQPAPVAPAAPAGQESREARLARALNDLMIENVDIQAAALVSLDGFTMASALPEGMHEDRVGAMSAAILGLGERAAAELGRGTLSQVFIEGAGGYVVLIAAGSRAVLTALADADAKLGLVLYDMRDTAEEITSILG